MHIEALEPLFALSPSESTPFLLELARRQAGRRRAASLLDQLARDAYVKPSTLDLRTSHRLDGLALDAAHEFEALLLSPVAPLGCCSVLAPTSQDRTLTAARGTEVVSDPTNVLALECARRLREAPSLAVRLSTLHEVLRAQPLPPGKHFSRHFRMFALAQAGLARPEDGFEVDAIARALATFDRLFDACERIGAHMPARRATIYFDPARETFASRVHAALARAVPNVELAREPFDSRYYAGIRVLFGARSVSGDHVPIADTGVFDWVARLTSNRRMRLVASGMGIQLVPLLYTPS